MGMFRVYVDNGRASIDGATLTRHVKTGCVVHIKFGFLRMRNVAYNTHVYLM